MRCMLLKDLNQLSRVYLVIAAFPNLLDETGILDGHIATTTHRVSLIDGMQVQISQ